MWLWSAMGVLSLIFQYHGSCSIFHAVRVTVYSPEEEGRLLSPSLFGSVTAVLLVFIYKYSVEEYSQTLRHRSFILQGGSGISLARAIVAFSQFFEKSALPRCGITLLSLKRKGRRLRPSYFGSVIAIFPFLFSSTPIYTSVEEEKYSTKKPENDTDLKLIFWADQPLENSHHQR